MRLTRRGTDFVFCTSAPGFTPYLLALIADLASGRELARALIGKWRPN
jgi:hypothetical protein